MGAEHPPRTVAVVGSGVAGLVAAYVASRTATVTVYEADDRLGGHADTHDVVDPAGTRLGIDTGFIVHNRRTYPTLLRVFAELGVATQESEMSMSIRDDDSDLEWAGALGRQGVFPTRGHLRRPAYLRLLTEIPRFHRRAKAVLASEGDDQTLRDFLAEHGFTPYFVRHFMEPLVAAVWSCDPEVALEYPARYLFSFLSHHGMLSVFGSPTWRTVSGGSHRYVEKVAAALETSGGTIRLGAKVTSLLETPSGVEVTDGNGEVTTYDAVVVAHPPAPGPGAARRAHRRAPRGARGHALLPQHRAAAHRHLADATADPDLGQLELHAPQRGPGTPRRQRRRGRHLRPHPPAAGCPPTPTTS